MAINDYSILIDITTGRLVRDIASDVQITPRPFVQGDTYNLRVMGVQPRPGRPIGRVFDYVALPSALYVALGNVGVRPSSGTWTITFGANTTSALDFDATPDEVETALNLLASIVSAGGVTVSGEAGGPYQVAFDDVGAQSAFTATVSGLYPLTSATIYEARAGDGSTSEIQIIALDRQSAALAETFTDLPAAAGSVEEVIAGDVGTGQKEIQRVTISEDAYDGTFSLAFGGASTVALPYNIEAADLQAELVAAGTWGDGVTVSGQFPIWDITFGGTAADKALATIDVSGLKVPVGKQGDFALNTAGIEALVAGSEFARTKLEVSGVISSKHTTILQVEATVLNDGIQNAPATGPSLPTYYTATEVDTLLGDYATTADLTALETSLTPIYAVAGSNQDFAAGDGVEGVMTDDNVLQFAVAANSVYEVCWCAQLSPSATRAGGIEHSVQWVLPSGASVSGFWKSVYCDAAATPPCIVWSSNNAMSATGPAYKEDGGTNAGGALNQCIITTGGTAGTAKLQFQCNLIVVSEYLRRHAGSYIIAKKLDI